MARRRFIHPDFFLDENLVILPMSTRLLFAGLWCLADREGRLQDKPLKIKMQLFPADQVDVNSGLDDLALAGMVTRYTVAGDAYIQITRFTKYQHPHPKEPESVIPRPQGDPQATPNGPCIPPQGDPQATPNGPCIPPQGDPQATPNGSCMTQKVIPRQHLGVVEQGGSSGSSDTQDLRSTPQPPCRGATRPRRRELRQQAVTIRQKAWGRCEHDPPCPDYATCIDAIVANLSARHEGAPS